MTLEMSRLTCSETSPLSCTWGVISTFTPTSRYVNWVLTSGLMPAPATAPKVEPKLPLAVGSFSPIFMVAFWPSTERICGDCRTLVRVSLNVACKSALGRMVEKSALARWPRRSEEHTSELQSLRHLVCRLLLETTQILRAASVARTCHRRVSGGGRRLTRG